MMALNNNYILALNIIFFKLIVNNNGTYISNLPYLYLAILLFHDFLFNTLRLCGSGGDRTVTVKQ